MFISNVLLIGQAGFFAKKSYESKDVFSHFKSNYKNIVKIMFINDLRIFAGTLFFFIPGIILTYQYMFVPYIVANNPDIEPSEAFKKSTELTNGIKFDLFILGLSFILWFILGSLMLGIGTLFVYPYYYASFAAAYNHQLLPDSEKIFEKSLS